MPPLSFFHYNFINLYIFLTVGKSFITWSIILTPTMQDMRCSPLSSAGCSFEYFIWLWGCTYFRCSFRVHFKQAPRQCLCHRKLSFHMRLTSPGEASRTEPSSFFDPFANSEDRRQSSGLWVLGFLSVAGSEYEYESQSESASQF